MRLCSAAGGQTEACAWWTRCFQWRPSSKPWNTSDCCKVSCRRFLLTPSSRQHNEDGNQLLTPTDHIWNLAQDFCSDLWQTSSPFPSNQMLLLEPTVCYKAVFSSFPMIREDQPHFHHKVKAQESMRSSEFRRVSFFFFAKARLRANCLFWI